MTKAAVLRYSSLLIVKKTYIYLVAPEGYMRGFAPA